MRWSSTIDWRGIGVFTERDIAKYPFVPEAAEYVRELDINIDDLAGPEYRSILDRAEERIEEAILFNLVSKQSPKDAIEIPSFPIAVMMVAATNDPFLKKRYAVAEAKRISNLLKDESKEKILCIVNNFKWRIRSIEVPVGSLTYDFVLRFTDFLKNAAVIQDKRWKLVNRLMLNGEVYLTKMEASRLLEEEVRKYIEGKLDIQVGLLPQGLTDRVERLKRLLLEKKGKLRLEEIPKGVFTIAFPPCIKALHNAISSGRSISHVGRFALTSFLINIGMTVENVTDLFRSLSDFDERMTRYQVEHIAGGRGSRTRYIPPRCDTLRTHGICPGMDEICRGVRHPLAYYRRKLRIIRAKPPMERA
ncbi:MAG: DNA primase large subunit PriL [Candidatus Bathyarchaeota archaeon BA1]|nr:MAG: DNA primase large subunit PriL [Candidatus Bathyarchaeota archaeon BA1]